MSLAQHPDQDAMSVRLIVSVPPVLPFSSPRAIDLNVAALVVAL